MDNLLSETVESITRSGHTTDEVDWVGSADGKRALAWWEFETVAEKVNYDSGYGGAEIPTDLVVVFTDGSWLNRGEYDGSEWWDFNRLPARDAGAEPFDMEVVEQKVGIGGWVTRDVKYV